jgi:putative tryptophan/tyrosine transport system substrate-binding protein
MRRREFITLLGGAAAAWPLAARAQQPAMPVIGYLSGLSASDRPDLVEMFRRGLGEAGYVEGRNVAIEYRYADNQPNRLRALATDLIARQVAAIAATGGNPPALAAKALTSTIPIVFTSGRDPIAAGLVSSLSRPEANLTGVSWFGTELGPKHIELLRDLVPNDALVALTTNPNNGEGSSYEQLAREAAAHAAGMQLLMLQASTASEIDGAFETIARQKASAVIVSSDPFYTSRASQFVVLAARYAIPVVHSNREFVAVGGLISYGNNTPENYRRAGVYVGRILKGARPADLPVDRATKFELVINLQTARSLKIDIPAKLLAIADEVIE